VSKIVAVLVFAMLAVGPSMPSREPKALERPYPKVHWRASHPFGSPSAGQLVGGVQLPAEGRHFFTWDPLAHRSPSPGWRRFGTDGLVRVTLRVIQEYAADHPMAPRVGIGDLSRPHGGDFGPRFGGPGHVSHQNGLDVDVYYPRKDRRERPPLTAGQANLRLSQDLVDRFVAAGAQVIFVGPNTGLVGPAAVVRVLAHHDNHLHVRLPPWLA
jgi:murein endopeptidase